MGAKRTVAVYGAGAVGGYLAALLARAVPSFEITLIGRPRIVEAIQQRGLRVLEGNSEILTHPTAVSSTQDIGPFDLVLLCVRTYDVHASIPDLRQLLGERGLLLALQNGVGTEEELATELGRDRVKIGALTVSTVMEEPGVIRRTSTRGGIALATMYDGIVPSVLLDAFAATGLATITVMDYRSLRWSKLLLNMLGAATSAILDLDLATLMADPTIFRIEQLAFREAGRVTDRYPLRTVNLPGYNIHLLRMAMRLPRPLAQQLLAPRLAGARSGRSPGTRADMARNKTEIGWYNESVVDAATRLELKAPVNAALAMLALDLASSPSRREEFRGKPEVLVAQLRSQGIDTSS